MIAAGRLVCGLVIAGLFVPFAAGPAAHAGLRFSAPLEGSALGAAPAEVQLTFVERPEPSLTTIRVSDTAGETYQAGEVLPVAGDPLSLRIALRKLPRGVYTVQWRVVSAVDGHATAGAFAFGVEVAPTAPAAAADIDSTVSWLELAGRVVFLAGLIVALGAASFALLAHEAWPWRRLAAIGTLASVAGLAALATAQWRITGASLIAFGGTDIGRAAIARAAAVGLMVFGAAIGARTGAIVLCVASAAAMVVHAAFGHAAAGRWPVASTTMLHAIHIAAAGVWIGGLVMLVSGLRGATTVERIRSIGRFSTLAAVGLGLVTVTGIVRSIQEVGDWDALTTAYGALVLAKVALLAAIAALGALNRWRHVPAAAADARPLGRTAAGEIALAALAVVAAGALATLPPPAAAKGLAGIEASGSDFATTVTATLTAVSEQPGPNRFTVAVADYDSGDTVTPDRVSLRFTPIDDPGVPPTTMTLLKAADGTFAGTGANLSFDGRWRVNVLIERGSTSADVPLEIEARGRPHTVSVRRVPNEPPAYRIELPPHAVVEVVVDPERPGPSELQISYYGNTTEPLAVRDAIVTVENDISPVQQLAIQRGDRHRLSAAVTLSRGTNHIAVIAYTESGARLRALLEVYLADRD